jgi:hypothetical protein
VNALHEGRGAVAHTDDRDAYLAHVENPCSALEKTFRLCSLAIYAPARRKRAVMHRPNSSVA